MFIFTHIIMCLCIYVCVCTYDIYMCIYVYIYIYMYLYMHTDRFTYYIYIYTRIHLHTYTVITVLFKDHTRILILHIISIIYRSICLVFLGDTARNRFARFVGDLWSHGWFLRWPCDFLFPSNVLHPGGQQEGRTSLGTDRHWLTKLVV